MLVPSSFVSFSTTNSSILRASYLNTGFTGVSTGTASIRATLVDQAGTVPPGDVSITVGDSSVTIVSVVASAFQPSDTLIGQIGYENPIVVSVQTSDGTTMPGILSGGWPDYTPDDLIPNLITLASDDPTQISFSRERGTAILLGNTQQPVTLIIAANQSCSIVGYNPAPNTVAVPVSGNLNLINEGDVDLGRILGSPMPILTGIINTPATSSPVAMRIRCSTSQLKGFDVAIVFDTTHVHVASCTVEPIWQGAFACTINNQVRRGSPLPCSPLW